VWPGSPESLASAAHPHYEGHLVPHKFAFADNFSFLGSTSGDVRISALKRLQTPSKDLQAGFLYGLPPATSSDLATRFVSNSCAQLSASASGYHGSLALTPMLLYITPVMYIYIHNIYDVCIYRYVLCVYIYV